MTRSSIRRSIVIAVSAAAVAAFAWLLRPEPLVVDIGVVRTGSIAETVADQGAARVRDSYVVSAPVGGRLERVALEVGDRVDANRTVVAVIRPAAPEFLDPRTRAQAEAGVQSTRSALAAARAQRDRLAAESERANDQFMRIAALARDGVASEAERVAADAEARQAAHALLAAEADIRVKEANVTSAQLATTTPAAARSQSVPVTSPASGVVTRILQTSERTVGVGTQLVEIANTDGLEAAIEFLSQDAVKIRVGSRCDVYDWGGPEPIPCEVRRIEPLGFTKVSALGVEEQRTLVVMRFTAPPAAWTGLGPGYRVWGRVYLRELGAATLAPIGALVRDRGEWAVYRVEGGRATLRRVQVGTMTDRDAEVLSGLSAGDHLVVYPSDQIVDGVPVLGRNVE